MIILLSTTIGYLYIYLNDINPFGMWNVWCARVLLTVGPLCGLARPPSLSLSPKW